MIKSKGKEDLFDEVPIEFIKSFGEVKFEEHTMIFGDFKRVDKFVSKDNAVKNLASFYVPNSLRGDEVME